MHPEEEQPYCPVCASKQTILWSQARDYEYFTSTNSYQYFCCRECYTIFIDPVPVNELKKIYPANYYSFVEGKKNQVTKIKEWIDRNYFKKLLKGLPGDQINILDVGGGTGWLLDQIRKADDRIAFTQIVDIDENAGNRAIEKGHAFAQMRIEEFRSERKFHLILLLNLIEHVEDPLQVLQHCDSLLSSKGVILIKTPNTRSLDARLFKNSYWGGLHCPRHWTIFSEKSFRLMVRKTNLNIRKLNYTQGAAFWAFSIIAMLYRKKMLIVSARKPIIFHWLFAPLAALFAMFDFTRKYFSKTSQMFITLEKKHGD